MLSWITPLIRIFSYCLLFRVMLTWIPELQRYPATRWLEKITDPYLNLFRNSVPLLFDRIDISPMIAMLSLQVIQQLLPYFL